MANDYRKTAAPYYDLDPALDDIPFYLSKIPSPDASVLELGCGTGRVLLPLSEACGYIHGVDHSDGMLDLCREKLHEASVPPTRARVSVGDITNLDIDRTFDLIIAPFRVIQNLETDEQMDGLFETIRKHLGPRGTCILNVFRPYTDPDALRESWLRPGESLNWEQSKDGLRIRCHERRVGIDREKLIVYPELVYRSYDGDRQVDEAVLKISMRCYYPDQFVNLIESHGFETLERRGGYTGEQYGEGPELVDQFALRAG